MTRQIVRRFLSHRLAVFGLIMLTIFALLGVFADALGPFPYRINPAFRAPPSTDYLLGTDHVGRDVFHRLVHASRVSLTVGLGVAVLSVVIGTSLGILAGFYRGLLDTALMRFTDIVLSFPPLVLVLVIVALVGPSLQNVIIVLGLLSWPTTARLVRASALATREEDYVQAARLIGAGDRRLIMLHMLPNTLTPVLVSGTLAAAYAILGEAALSFLGLGVQPPQPSWGNMLLDAQSLSILQSMPWLWLPPGFMILMAVLSINFVGDGIRDAMDPRTYIHTGPAKSANG